MGGGEPSPATRDRTVADCLVIGAGPAGLTAAIYLARFHLTVAVVDSGASRAATIPRTRNHAGYPGGIPGTELLARMRDQAGEFGVRVRPGTVERLSRRDDLLVAHVDGQELVARTVLLATGVVNNRPDVADDGHDAALARGLIRYCPICDGYEVTDLNVGVIGAHEHGMNEAIFLRMYSDRVTLVAPDAGPCLSDAQHDRLRALGIAVVEGPCGPLRIEGERIVVPVPGRALSFDTVYPALGSVIRSDLAVGLGADATDEGCLVIDDHQRTTVAGVYAAGDVVKGLDQISHAMGEGGVAATAIRNDLARDRPLTR